MKLSFIYYSKWDKLELVVNHKMRTVSKEFRVRYFVRIPFENGRVFGYTSDVPKD